MKSQSYEVFFKNSALKEFQSLPQKIQQKVLDAVQLLALNPYTDLLQIKRLKGADALYRVRIQDYRVIYYIENQQVKIVIIKVAHRKEVY